MKKYPRNTDIRLVSVRDRNGDEIEIQGVRPSLMRDELGLPQKQHQQATRERFPRDVTPSMELPAALTEQPPSGLDDPLGRIASIGAMAVAFALGFILGVVL